MLIGTLPQRLSCRVWKRPASCARGEAASISTTLPNGLHTSSQQKMQNPAAMIWPLANCLRKRSNCFELVMLIVLDKLSTHKLWWPEIDQSKWGQRPHNI